MKNILIINGSLSGSTGNSQVLLEEFNHIFLKSNYETKIIDLKSIIDTKNEDEAKAFIKKQLDNCHGLVFATGTHWDSWSSYTQRFLELMTDFEASSTFMGKPVSVIVTMHSVGGKSVLSRLQGVFNTLGMLIPPMSGLVYSLVNQIASESKSSHADDLWSLEDINPISHNFMEALSGTHKYQSWPVDKKDPSRIWIKSDKETDKDIHED